MKSTTIKHIVEEYFEIDLSDPSRKREFICPRMIYYKLCNLYCREETELSIAETVNKDRVTYRHGLKTFESSLNKHYFRNYAITYIELKESIKKVYNFKTFMSVNSLDEVKNEYRVKLFDVTKKHQKELSALKQRLGVEHEIVEKVFMLPPNDIEDFLKLANVFYKRKQRELKYAN
jgi:hypothetical protein